MSELENVGLIFRINSGVKVRSVEIVHMKLDEVNVEEELNIFWEGGLKRVLPKLEGNMFHLLVERISNRRMKTDDWIRIYYKNLKIPFVSGGMRWKFQEGRIVRVSLNENV